MKNRTIAASVALVLCGSLIPTWGQQDELEGPEQVLKMVEEIAAGKRFIRMPLQQWTDEGNRLQRKLGKAQLEVKVLELVLSKKRAEAETAKAELELFQMTHTVTP